MKLTKFMTGAADKPVYINPQSVAAVTLMDGKTVVRLNATNSEGNGLYYKVDGSIEDVVYALKHEHDEI